MEEVDAENETKCSRPCEYFDLIGGSGVGGLIAVMLGRLRMVTSYPDSADTL
jgi:patatin-like phospholipase/acyl hydrolase